MCEFRVKPHLMVLAAATTTLVAASHWLAWPFRDAITQGEREARNGDAFVVTEDIGSRSLGAARRGALHLRNANSREPLNFVHAPARGVQTASRRFTART